MPRIETNDYYAIIDVANTATPDEIKKSYRRRARDLHPDKNHSNPNATADFQRLGEAYETLNDSEKRRAYDIIWPGIRTNEQAEKSRRDAAEASRQQAAQEAMRKQKAEEERQSRLKRLIAESNRYQGDVFECSRRVKRLTAEIARLQGLDDEELRKEKERNSWWIYLSSPIYGKVLETEDEKRHREVERLQRVASRSIKKNELAREEADLQRLKDFVRSTNDKIDAEYRRREDERREAEAKKRAAEARKQADAKRAELERIRAEMQRRQQEADRLAREQRERLEKEQAAAAEARRVEQQRMWEEMHKRQQETERLARVQREKREKEQAAAAEAYRKLEQQRQEKCAKRDEQRKKELQKQERRAARGHRVNRAQNIADTTAGKTPCQHSKFWPKIDGGQSCSHCHEYQPRFVFQCPDCKMIACANCRQSMRGENQRSGKGRRKNNAGTG